jgi:phospholipid:diacylglycerol acyltransferase
MTFGLISRLTEQGGNRIWGNQESAPVSYRPSSLNKCTHVQDDPDNTTDTYGRFFNFRHPGVLPTNDQLTKDTVSPNMTVDEATPHILAHTPSAFQRMMEANYSTGFESDSARLKENGKDHRKVSSIAAPIYYAVPRADQ